MTARHDLDRNAGRTRARRRAALAGLVACAIATSVCVGCSDEETINLSPICMVFNPIDPVGSPFAARTGPDSTCNKLELEIVAREAIAGAFSMELTFRYPLVGVLDPGSIEVGSVWEGVAGTIPVESLAVEDPAGTVQLGISRVAGPGVTTFDLAPGDVLVTLSFFQSTTAGSGNLTFRSAQLSNDAIPPAAVGPSFNQSTLPDGIVAGQIAIVTF